MHCRECEVTSAQLQNPRTCPPRSTRSRLISFARWRASCPAERWICRRFPKSPCACAGFSPIPNPPSIRSCGWWARNRRWRRGLLRIANSASLNRSGTVGHGFAHRDQPHRLQHGAQRLDLLRHGADPQQQQARGPRAPSAGSLAAQHPGGRVRLRAGTHLHAQVNPDEAMLTGMMHGIGKLYVLTRATDHPELFANAAMLDEIIERMASLDRQGDPGELGVPRGHGAGGRRAGGSRREPSPRSPDLSDVIAIAVLMAAHARGSPGARSGSEGLPAARRLGLERSARTRA